MTLKRINRLSKDKILLGPPFLTNQDRKNVLKVLESGQLSLGPMLAEFEKQFANWLDVKYAVGVSSGTTGLHLCIKALGIKTGDEVITSPFSFVASSNCILYEQAKPIFVDIDPVSFNIDVNKIEKAITKKTKAILVVHIFGYPVDLDKIYSLGKKHNLPIIEDAAEALGALYNGRKVGSFGNLSVFAFYPNKQMTTGEGGIVTTNDKSLYLYLKGLANQGRAIGDEWLQYKYLGYNYRLAELNAALGLGQLEKLDYFLANRKKVAGFYEEFLKPVKTLKLLKPDNEKQKRSWFLYVIRLDKKINRSRLMRQLKNKGIPTRAYLPSIHLQSFYKKLFGLKKGMFPVCEEISSQTLALPFYTGMEKSKVSFICKNLIDLLKSSL